MYGVFIALRILLPTKELKVVLWVMIALIVLPAMGMAVIVNTPAAVLQSIFGTSDYNPVSTVNPAPTGIAILGDFTYPGDMYEPGNCTYWVSARRSQVGEPIPQFWGDATHWADNARKDGYVVDHTPTPNAIMQISGVANGLGHVAFVESVDPDGTWHMSEMNAIGLYIVDHKAMPPSTDNTYNFIHEKSTP